MKGNKVDIVDLAELIIIHCLENNIDINYSKLQHLLYYTQAWHLVHFEGNPLFDDEAEAWASGPSYRVIYERFKDLDIQLFERKLKIEKIISHIENTRGME